MATESGHLPEPLCPAYRAIQGMEEQVSEAAVFITNQNKWNAIMGRYVMKTPATITNVRNRKILTDLVY